LAKIAVTDTITGKSPHSAVHIILRLCLEHLGIDAAAALCKLIMGAVFLDGILCKYG